MRTSRISSLLAALLLTGAFACTGNGHLEPQPFSAKVGDTAVNCNCNISFDHDSCTGGKCKYHFPIEVCLPPELNAATIDFGHSPTPAGNMLANLSQAEFEKRVDAYCKQTMTDIVYHLIQVFNGGWCDYKAPYSPQGYIGESVSCFPLAINSDGGKATEPLGGNCARPCDRVACDYSTNCGEGVQDSFGNINLDKCQCNQVTQSMCPGDPPSALPTPVFCRP